MAETGGPPPIFSDVAVSYAGGKMTVNEYRFLSFIGRGSYAEVVLAQHTRSGVLFAVKCFSKSRLLKKRDIRRVAGSMIVITGLDKVQVEIQIMRVLSGVSPHLVGLHAVLADPASDDLYLIIDFGDAGPLMEFDEGSQSFRCRAVGGGVLPLPLARQCLADLLAALVALRSRGIAHRDLKPDNLLLHSDGRLLVADFGVAQQFAVPGVDTPVRSALARAIAATAGYDSDTGRVHSDDDDDDEERGGDDDDEGEGGGRSRGGVTSGEDSTPRSPCTGCRRPPPRPSSRLHPPGWVSDTAGTFQFLAPEACSSSSGYDAFSADLWAAGVCFYTMLFGVAPFGRHADSPMSLFDAIQTEALFPLPFHLAEDPAATAADAGAIAMLSGLLTRDPAERMTLDAAVAHPFVTNGRARMRFPAIDVGRLQPYSSPELAMHEHFAQRGGGSRSSKSVSEELPLAQDSFSDGEEGRDSEDDDASETRRPPLMKRQSLLQSFLASCISQPPPVAVAASAAPVAPPPLAPAPTSAAILDATEGRTAASTAPAARAAAAGAAGDNSRNRGGGAAPTELVMTGWLQKRGRTCKSWRRRYFELTGVSLTYYSSAPAGAATGAGVGRGGGGTAAEGESTRGVHASGRQVPSAGVVRASAPRGRMDMSATLAVERASKPDKPFRFRVVTTRRELLLQADSEPELTAWIAAFEAVKQGHAALGGK